ncbi:hypothetical protein THAOC_18133, partial [Thalassiosira oceanica]
PRGRGEVDEGPAEAGRPGVRRGAPGDTQDARGEQRVRRPGHDTEPHGREGGQRGRAGGGTGLLKWGADDTGGRGRLGQRAGEEAVPAPLDGAGEPAAAGRRSHEGGEADGKGPGAAGYVGETLLGSN